MILFVRSFFNRFSLLLLLFSFALTVSISGCEISGCGTEPAREAKVSKRMRIEYPKKKHVKRAPKKVIRKKATKKKKRPVKTTRPDVKWVSPKRATIKRKSAPKAEAAPKREVVAKKKAAPKKSTVARKARASKKKSSSTSAFKPASGTNYVVSLSSYTERSKAAALARKLSADGYNAYVTETKVKGTKWYRVRCGFYEGYTQATRVKNELVKRYFAKGAWVDKPTRAEVAEFAK